MEAETGQQKSKKWKKRVENYEKNLKQTHKRTVI